MPAAQPNSAKWKKAFVNGGRAQGLVCLGLAWTARGGRDFWHMLLVQM